MSNSPRQSHLISARNIVVKLGTQLVTDVNGALDVEYLTGVAHQVAALRKAGVVVTLVSSGAVGAGVGGVGLARRPAGFAERSAGAAGRQRTGLGVLGACFLPLKAPGAATP